MISLLAAVAWSAPSEEVIVYGDEFVRWDGTRWWIEDEMVLPSSLVFAADNNVAFTTHALQVRAVVACDKDARLSAKRWEVGCVIEDIGMLVTTIDRWRPQAHPRVQEVLDDVDGRLTGAEIQLQVDNQGGITNFDIEGLVSDNLRERSHQEASRTLVNQLMAGFHLKIPDQGQRDGQWVEQHTELMDIPSITASRGSTVVVHQASAHEGNRLVQTTGRGTIAVGITWTNTDPFNESKLGEASILYALQGGPPTEYQGMPSMSMGGWVPMVFPPPDPYVSETTVSEVPAAGERRVIELEATWDAKLTAVALFQKATGIMTERVWVAYATATAGSLEGTGPYLNVGRLHILGPDEKPDVGPTKQVAWPGQAMEGLDPWTDLPPP